MKRSLPTSISSGGAGPEPKKAKPLPSTDTLKSASASEAVDDAAEWSTVGKRKTKTAPSGRQDVSPPTLTSNSFPRLPRKPEDEGDQWVKVEKRKAKKARKVEERLDNSPPRFFYVNSDIVRRQEAIGIGDIRDLVLHLLGEAGPQPWLKVENRHVIKKVVTLFVPGILPEHLNIDVQPTSATTNPNLPVSIPLPRDSGTSAFGKTVVVKTLFGGTKEIVPQGKAAHNVDVRLPFVARTFSHACPTRAPGDAFRMHSVLSAFFQGPVSADERRRRAVASAKTGNMNSSSPLRYVLTPAQMLENKYPLPSYLRDASVGLDAGSTGACQEGWEETQKPDDETASGAAEVFAVDCEMCLTEDGKELTRVCVIAYESGDVLLDQLVKPSKPIIDYLTKWSGITEEALRDVSTPLTSARGSVLSLVSASRTKTGHTPILLGHSLESDLGALKLAHPRCIDTALLYHHPRGRPLKPGLAWLTKKWCAREIQNRGEGGHDAEEDARACVELLKRKVEGGPGFGEYKTTTEYESVFERLRRSIRGSASGEPGSGEGARLRTAVVDRGNPATWHGAGAGRTVACVNDEEVTKGVLQCVDDNDFIWARFSGLAEAQSWLRQKANGEGNPRAQTDTVASDASAIDAALKTLNSQLALVHAALPARTAFVVFTGHSDPRAMVALQAQKAAFESALRGGKDAREVPEGVRWMTSDARALEEAVERARRGMLFLCLK